MFRVVNVVGFLDLSGFNSKTKRVRSVRRWLLWMEVREKVRRYGIGEVIFI